jgi:hypothetical protein
MPRVSQGVQRFRAQTDQLVTEAQTSSRNVTKKEVASALFEMVRNDKLSQADRREAESFLDSGAPLTRGARTLLAGFSNADQQSIAHVMAAATQIASGTQSAGNAQPRVYASIDRLNAMYELFTDRGNKKLDAGEVQALAGFYSGLKSTSRAKIKDRMIEIYQSAGYSAGQQAALRQLLEYAGLTRAELEGTDPTTPGGFTGMSDSARVDSLMELYADYPYDAIDDLAANRMSDAVRTSIQADVDSWIEQELAGLQGEDDPQVWEAGWKELHLVDEDTGDRVANSSPIAFSVEVNSTFGNGGNTQALFFDLSGKMLGSDYLTEE